MSKRRIVAAALFSIGLLVGSLITLRSHASESQVAGPTPPPTVLPYTLGTCGVQSKSDEHQQRSRKFIGQPDDPMCLQQHQLRSGLKQRDGGDHGPSSSVMQMI